MADQHPSLPLEGITVVSLEHAIAAPLATRHLADLGARVIKIERPGSGMRFNQPAASSSGRAWKSRT